MAKKKIAEISSSFRVVNNQIDEVTWTPEETVLTKLGYSHDDLGERYRARHTLRLMAKQGLVLQRRNPEHAFHEYGPAWRQKGFKLSVEAAQATEIIKGMKDDE